MELIMVRDRDSLADAGGGYYEAMDGSATYAVLPGEEGGGALVQGALEVANVQLSDEMVTLLLLQRAYAANAQVVQAGDQLMSIVNSLRR
jgi:flagellar basal-body rod protein FlgG